MVTESKRALLARLNIPEAPKSEPEGPKFFRLDSFSSGWTWHAGRFSVSWTGPRVTLFDDE